MIEGERKLVTALFADLKGSTEMMESLDPEEARAIIDPALRIMVEAVRRYQGYVVQSTGDGIFALFGAPAAYEDHPPRALHAAVQMQQQLREYSQRLADQRKPALEVRVGVNTGEVVVRTVETGGKLEYTPIGHTVNLAARLQTVAAVGSVVVSEHTRRLAEGYFELRPLGPMLVKGVSEPVSVYEVIGSGPLRTHFQLSARRGLTRFVGRGRELEQIKHALELARAGHGQVVAIVAEAGAGKSRLFHEFKATLPPECKVLEAYSVSHGKASAWLPVLELLRGYFEIRDTDEAANRREKVRTAVNAPAPALSDIVPYLFGLLGIQDSPDPLAQMDPQIRRRRMLDAIRRVFIRESLNQPLVLIDEDLHWIDSETQALLDLLADSIANTRVLLLVNYRPEYRHDWTNKSCYSQFRLSALEEADAGAMLSALLGDEVELNAVKRLVIERSEGNPFFIEEMVQALFDEGAIVRNGAVRVARSLSQVRLPPTVQGILASRIDRLPSAHKGLLGILAVMGRASLLTLIRPVAMRPDVELDSMLAALQAGEFIYEAPIAAGIEYTFKHVLTQEVAYNSILVERRKQLHEHAAQAIESIFAASLTDHYDDLARHYSRSSNGLKAAYYLELAARQAMTRGALAEASVQLESALELLVTQPDTPERDRIEIAVRLSLGFCLIHTVQWEQSEAVLLAARQLCEKLQDDAQLFEVLWTIYYQSFVRQQHQKLNPLGRELLTVAERTRDIDIIGRARIWLAASFNQEGNLLSAQEQLDQISRLPAASTHNRNPGIYNWRVQAPAFGSFTFWALGFPDRLPRRAENRLFWHVS